MRLLAVVLACLPGIALGQTARFDLPIECRLGEDCFVQKYVDVDPGPDYRDHACGRLTSDSHRGTDFRIVPGRQARVLAAADGVVLRVRDGEPDLPFDDAREVDPDRACGNAVMIEHPGGTQTLSCHLALGSVSVEPGDEVRAGDPIGRVGASGNTGFRHVHFGVLDREGRTLDPFTGVRQGRAACGQKGDPLWSRAAARALDGLARTNVLIAGFTDRSVTIEEIENAELSGALTRSSGALVAYGMAIGVEAGDTERLTIEGPGIALDESWPIDRPRAQVMRFLGKRVAEGLAPGTYRMWYGIVRDGRVVDAQDAVLTVR